VARSLRSHISTKRDLGCDAGTVYAFLVVKEIYMKEKTVPVIVDDRKDMEEFMMTRVAYYYIEMLDQPDGGPIDYGDLGVPVLLLEFSGAIYKPIDTEEFETPEQIDKLFETVESHKSLYIDSDNIWVPNKLFDKKPERGDIFRVGFDLFVRMYSLSRSDTIFDSKDSRFGKMKGLIKFSKIETKAFAEWADRIKTNFIESYPKNEKLKLKRSK